MFMEIFEFIFHQSEAFYIHILNLFVLVILIFLFVYARQNREKWTRISDYLGTVTKTVNSIRYGDLSKKIEKIDNPNSEQLTESINRMIETLHDREVMIVEYQNELHRQNKFLEAVINSLSDGLIIIDDKANILRATPKISLWFEEDGNKLINKNLEEFIQIPQRKTFYNLTGEDIFVKNNRSLNFTARTMELKLEEHKKLYVIIIKNITDQKELETLKEDFVATLTHDLKVPIIAETNMIELFLNESFGEISPKQELALNNMKSSNKELLDLVQIVLETYKMRDGNIKLYKEDIMLKGFLTEIIEEMSPIAGKTHNKLEFMPSRDIRVYADKIQLKRVIKNLIQNAISYGEKNSPIEIKIGEIPNYITIKIKDYGAGISQTDINKIFNKYYSAAKKFRKIGTGLGLYLALEIVKAHGGDLTVESTEGEFTEFCIKLPAAINGNVYFGQ